MDMDIRVTQCPAEGTDHVPWSRFHIDRDRLVGQPAVTSRCSNLRSNPCSTSYFHESRGYVDPLFALRMKIVGLVTPLASVEGIVGAEFQAFAGA